jgi:uncharacterized RDD family membrane protein YckC
MSTPQPRPDPLAGFWRRLGAFAIDGLVLGGIGLVLGLTLSDQFVQLGPWGRLLVFGVALGYFGLLNSQVGGGQTLGKRALGIKVVSSDGGLLSIPRAGLRFLPIGVPWFLNNAQLPAAVSTSVWAHVWTALVFGLGLVVTYLFVFNRVTRQSLHDLWVGSQVVRVSAQGAIASPPIWRVHQAVCGAVIAGVLAVSVYMQTGAETASWTGLRSAHEAVSTPAWVSSAHVSEGVAYAATVKSGQSKTSYLNISAQSKAPNVEDVQHAKELAQLALRAYPAAGKQDVIRVVLVHGYDIGIASFWRSQKFDHAPAAWLAL